FPLFLWDNKTNPTSWHVLSPAEIAEIAERLRVSEQRFPLFPLFLRDNSILARQVFVSRRKGRKGRKSCAE
ncbi:MAG: hypothetical protein SPL50_03715, partial [Alloprevotella sp.]|nr:hypothetical protein [Alloprevotella sp.]